MIQTLQLPKLICHVNSPDIFEWLLFLYGGSEYASHLNETTVKALDEGLVRRLKRIRYEEKRYDLTLKGHWFIKLMLDHTELKPFQFMQKTYPTPKEFIAAVDYRSRQFLDGVPDDQIIDI